MYQRARPWVFRPHRHAGRLVILIGANQITLDLEPARLAAEVDVPDVVGQRIFVAGTAGATLICGRVAERLNALTTRNPIGRRGALYAVMIAPDRSSCRLI